ncbi:MAG TPA: response regulator transcription factor [Burkholderiales bacterium]|nr:response regulator transcription factor [Burkholderiales bacterium]
MAISTYIVDDHAVVIDGLRSLLDAEPDIEVVGHASDGRTALREIGVLKPDAVIMDIAMPELNGIEAARLIHGKHPEIRIVMLSMHSSTEHVFRALQAGARAYVLKASAGSEVIDALRVVHLGRRYLSQRIAETVIDDYIGAHTATGPLDELSSRERQVLQLFAEGRSIAETAQTLALSPRTVETYRARLMQKLGIDNLPDLVKFAILHGVTSLD